MEADGLGLELLDNPAKSIVERFPNGRRVWRVRVDSKLGVVGPEPVPPSSFPGRVGARRRMAKEVQIDRPRGPLPDHAEIVARLIRREHGAWQRAQPTCFRDLDYHLGRHCSGHRGLNDGMLDAEEVEKPGVGPHGRCP